MRISDWSSDVCSSDLEPIELAAFVQGRVGKFRAEAKAKRIDLVVQIEPTLGEVSGDSRRLCESLDHLLSNAPRYPPEGGRVLVHGDGTSTQARIIVSDTGHGLD